jgi:dihydropteroate synthase
MDSLNSFQSMGVLNLTPDSFSDGGKYASSSSVLKQIEKMKKDGCRIFDFGAESTAPFNKLVSLEHELKRFEQFFFPILDSLHENDVISIDTYKVEVMESLMSSGKLDQYQVIFNDVSGALDSKLEEFLLKNPNVHYVFSHNLSPGRDQTQDHMNYVSSHYGHDLMNELIDYFEGGLEWFRAKGIGNTILFDPCFGFSKDYQQNLDLLQFIPDLIKGHGLDRTWLLGISKKSFLRKLVGEKMTREEQFRRAEQAHVTILTSWMQLVPKENQIVIRLHDISLFQSVKRCKFLYES